MTASAVAIGVTSRAQVSRAGGLYSVACQKTLIVNQMALRWGRFALQVDMAAVAVPRAELAPVSVAGQARGHGRAQRPPLRPYADVAAHAVAVGDAGVALVGEAQVLVVRDRADARG
jgi:hypothetical protein